MDQIKHRQSTAHEVHFDPSLYPRTYSLSRYNQWSYIMPGFSLAVVLLVQFWRSHGLNSQPTILFGLLFVLMGGYFVLRGLRQELILEPEAITVRYAFSTRRLERHEIAGWRKSSGGARWTGLTGRTVIPRDDAQKAVAFYEIKTDAAFFAWFSGIPELEPSMDTPPDASLLKMFITWVGIVAGVLAIFLLFILLNHRPFEIQVVSLVADTEFVFFLVFCDSRGWRRYSLRNKQVQRELPRLLGIHCLFLVLIFALLTFALSAQSRLPSSWLVESGPRDVSPFAFGLILIGVITVMTQAWILRKILKLALEAESTAI
jgi:hypothetical protein